jgi:acyl-CoA dehydrogenase
MTRLLCLKAADMMDKVGNKTAQLEIAMIRVAAPNMALRIIDQAIQAFGGAGVSDEAGLAKDYADIRSERLADGPDEVHTAPLPDLNSRSMQIVLRIKNGRAELSHCGRRCARSGIGVG